MTNSKRPSLWIKVFAPGIGDLVVILPILKNLKQNYVQDMNMIVFTQAQHDLLTRFPYTDSVVILPDGIDPRSLVPHGEFYVDIAETEMEKNYWWGSEEFIKEFGHMHIYDVMSKAIQIGGDYENIEPLECFYTYQLVDKTVLLGIGGRRANKLWFNDCWLELAKELKYHGYTPVMVGDRDHNGSDQISQLIKEGLDFLPTKSLADCIDVISCSSGMITIDSGLMHISAMQRVPTVAMFGPMPSWLWGPKAKHVKNLDGGCGINCSKAPLDWECVGRPCMRSFKPKEVLNEFLRLKERLKHVQTQ